MSGSAILFSGKADVVIQNDVSLTSFGIVYQEFFSGEKNKIRTGKNLLL